ncbi:MAG: formate dehydrogenase subunit gamma [Acidimicrobiales bacterium]|jgi:formate dehydrogenase subunit gamma
MVSKTTSSHVPWSEERALALVERHREERGPLMPILRELQEVFGHIDPRAVDVVAEALNLSKAEVYGVITFYKDFRSEPPGASLIQVCRAEACQSMGAERLARHAREHLGVEFGGTTPDGAITLEQVFCLGNCALSPAVMVDGRLKGRVDEARFDELVADARGQAT